MAHLVDGKWKKLTFRLLTPTDIFTLSEYFKNNFYQDEPLSAIIGLSKAKVNDFDKIVADILTHNLSFAAYCQVSGQMAGVHLCSRRRKNQVPALFELESDEMKIAARFLKKFIEFDVFALYNLTDHAELRVVSVGKEYRNQGLAKEMFVRGFEFLRASGFKVIKAGFTNPYSRKIALDFGYRELAREYYKDIQDLNGKMLSPSSTDDEYTALMIKQL